MVSTFLVKMWLECKSAQHKCYLIDKGYFFTKKNYFNYKAGNMHTVNEKLFKLFNNKNVSSKVR